MADHEGNIASAPAGSFLKRRGNRRGYQISEGWTGENDILGVLNFEEKPALVNPKEGFIFSANQ